MRTFKYLEQDGEHTITEAEIIDQYYLYWSDEMRKVGKEELITEENCIQDFIVVNWAWEIK